MNRSNQAGVENFILEMSKVNNVGNDRYVRPKLDNEVKGILLYESDYKGIVKEIYGNEGALPMLRDRLFKQKEIL